MMFKLASALLLAAGAEASYQAIVGYEPGSKVTDHNALDLDQAAMEKQLAFQSSDSFGKAQRIYEEGAHSKSIAVITLTSAPNGPINAGATVTGVGENGSQVTGTVLENVANSQTVEVQYDTIAIQNEYVGCRVGANPDPYTAGCFDPSQGNIVIDGASYPYTYNALTNTRNGRTLQGFSLQARDKMYDCSGQNCPHSTYSKFYNYYEQFDYADRWVTAAFEGRQTDFANGNADFAEYGYEGRAEAVKKGTAFMNVWMYVIREMEDAISDCVSECDFDSCNDDPVHAWDEAVAFYAGSLEGTDGAGSGVMLHALADKRCANFKTCGDLADEYTGTSHVNREILREFIDGKRKLLAGECSSLKENKKRIEAMMAVPLIQGTLRYAYFTDIGNDLTEKSEAEGAVFAASVLPLVHDCDDRAATTIYNNMKVGQNGSANFVDVKKAFESVYKCMDVRCADVGGLYDIANDEYFKHAKPCGSGSSSDVDVGLAVGLSFAGLFIVIIAFFVARKCCGSHSNNNIQTHDLDLQKDVA